MNIILKILTAIFREKVEDRVDLIEEQQWFRKNRSTKYAISIIRQMLAKWIDYNKPAYM